MGMHIGLVCARTTATQLRETFIRTWTKFEAVESVENLPDMDAVWAWKESHEKSVSAAQRTKEDPSEEVYLFWQDGPWAIMMDSSYTLASDEEGLTKLSVQLGTILSFIVESASGCAEFWCFENGKLRRSIHNEDTVVHTHGEPLAEETGIGTSHYYMAETEGLWKAFGLSPYKAMESSVGCQAICVIDRTDYTDLLSTKPKAPQKPRWKFW